MISDPIFARLAWPKSTDISKERLEFSQIRSAVFSILVLKKNPTSFTALEKKQLNGLYTDRKIRSIKDAEIKKNLDEFANEWKFWNLFFFTLSNCPISVSNIWDKK